MSGRKKRGKKRWTTTEASRTAQVLTGNQEVCPICHHTVKILIALYLYIYTYIFVLYMQMIMKILILIRPPRRGPMCITSFSHSTISLQYLVTALTIVNIIIPPNFPLSLASTYTLFLLCLMIALFIAYILRDTYKHHNYNDLLTMNDMKLGSETDLDSESHLFQPFDYLSSVVTMEDNCPCQFIHSTAKVCLIQVLSQHLFHHLQPANNREVLNIKNLQIYIPAHFLQSSLLTSALDSSRSYSLCTLADFYFCSSALGMGGWVWHQVVWIHLQDL